MNEILTDDGNGFPELPKRSIEFGMAPIYPSGSKPGEAQVLMGDQEVIKFPFRGTLDPQKLQQILFALLISSKSNVIKEIYLHISDYQAYQAACQEGDARDPGPSWTPYDGPEERGDNS